MRSAFASSIVLYILISGGAALAAEPWAVIDGTDWPKVEPYSAPVTIASIDGKDYLKETRRTLAPGMHKLEFITTRTTRASKLRQTREIDIELKPCTVYYFYAKHPSKFADEWELKILRESAITKCGR